MFGWIKSSKRRAGHAEAPAAISAATALPEQAPPKRLLNRQITLPSFLSTAKPDTKSPLTLTERNLTTTDLTTYRSGATARGMIRDFVLSSPDLSAAVTAYIRTAITNRFTLVAYNPDGTVNPEGTAAAQAVATRFDVLNDYTLGFDSSPSILAVSESWVRELRMYGAASGELVLDKTRLPTYVQPVSVVQVKFYPSSDARRLIPTQVIGSDEISLDLATYFYVSLDQDLQSPYAISPIETALQPTIFSADFLNDIRRVVKRAIHPRAVVTIDEEKFRKGIPPDIVGDSNKLAAYMNDLVQGIEDKVNGAKPEDVWVMFDTLGVDVVDHGNTNLSNEYEVVQGVADAKLATGAGVLPTILGHSSGTQNTASAEVLIFLKYVEGIQRKLHELWSKIFTLAVRLLGYDVVVKFAFDAIDLRPENELESFKALKQSRILEQLSLGLITDEEASILLTGHLPPAGYKPLKGTGFRPNTAVQPEGNGYNGASNSGSTMNQKLNPQTPTGGARGSNKQGS